VRAQQLPPVGRLPRALQVAPRTGWAQVQAQQLPPVGRLPQVPQVAAQRGWNQQQRARRRRGGAQMQQVPHLPGRALHQTAPRRLAAAHQMQQQVMTRRQAQVLGRQRRWQQGALQTVPQPQPQPQPQERHQMALQRQG